MQMSKTFPLMGYGIPRRSVVEFGWIDLIHNGGRPEKAQDESKSKDTSYTFTNDIDTIQTSFKNESPQQLHIHNIRQIKV